MIDEIKILFIEILLEIHTIRFGSQFSNDLTLTKYIRKVKYSQGFRSEFYPDMFDSIEVDVSTQHPLYM